MLCYLTSRCHDPCRSPHPPPVEGVKRLLLCSGKLYYELNAKRAELGNHEEVAIVRIEQVKLNLLLHPYCNDAPHHSQYNDCVRRLKHVPAH